MVKFWVKEKIPAFVLRSGLSVSFTAQVDAELSADFRGNLAPKLPVIVYSHGLSSSAKSHVALCKELASYGCMVVAFDHLDGSCGFSVHSTTKEPVLFDGGIEFGDQKKRKE